MRPKLTYLDFLATDLRIFRLQPPEVVALERRTLMRTLAQTPGLPASSPTGSDSWSTK
jgi:hypothetical protein